MKFLAALITCVAFVSALPSPELQSGNSLGSTALPTRDVAGCNPGQLYCFGQIIHDLGTSTLITTMRSFQLIHGITLHSQFLNLVRFINDTTNYQ